MSWLDFTIDAGKKLLGLGDDDEHVKKEIQENESTMPVDDLDVKVEGDTVVISGTAADAAARSKAVLIAGNVKGIAKVDYQNLSVQAGGDEFYEIKSGDTLSKIAQTFYGSASRYPEIVEANKEVIKDANLIYPGQKIRIPR